MPDVGVLIATGFAAVALLVIAWRSWGANALARMRSVENPAGRIASATVVVAPNAIRRGDTEPTRVGLHVEHSEGTFTTWEAGNHLPMRIRRRTVGLIHAHHAPRIPVADPRAALAQARSGGFTFDLDPPIEVTVHRGPSGSYTWS